MDTDRPKRLFFALWPDAATQARMAALVHDLPRRDGRRVPPENLHVTLLFLGGVDAAGRACAEAAAGAVIGPPFTLLLDACGYWPKPRVAWIGTSTVPAALLRLRGDLDAALGRCGVRADPQPFAPHVTVLRDARAVLQPPPVAIEWRVGSFVLAESETHAGGARYTVLRTWALAAQ